MIEATFFTSYQLDFSFLKVKFLLVSVIFRIFAKEMTLERRMLAQAKKEYNTRFLPSAPTYKGGRSPKSGYTLLLSLLPRGISPVA